MYFNASEPPFFERRALEHPARLDAFPDRERNRHGYRSDEFDLRGDMNIGFVGCSWTEGEAVARGSIYPDLVKEKLADLSGRKVQSWNFGQSASGIEYAARVLPALIELKPDFVVVVFSGPDRREYFSADGRRMVYSNALGSLAKSGDQNAHLDLASTGPVIECFSGLQSAHQDLATFALQARAISSMLNLAGIGWLYSCVDTDAANRMITLCQNAGVLSAANHLGHPFRKLDQASETNPHPGTESHAQFAEEVVRAISSGQGQPDIKSAKEARISQGKSWWRWLGKPKKPADPRPPASANDDDDVYPMW